MTTDFLIEAIGNGDNDLVIEDNDFVLVGHTAETHGQAVLQDITYEVGTWFGESAFDRNAGFPWREAVFGEEPIDGIGALVQDRISKLEGVDGFEEAPILTLDATRTKLFIRAQVKAGDFILPLNTEVSDVA